MNYSVTTLGKKTIAGFHLVGPWDQTVKQGFEQLMMWVENHQVPAREWWITILLPRGCSFSTVCCRAQRIAWPPGPVLRSISTMATMTATGISTCMSPLSALRRSGLPLFRTRIFTFPACSGRKSSYNWPFRFAGEGCAR